MAILLGGCATATQYKPLNSYGGYSEYRFSDKVYQVKFAGNSYTSKNRSSDLAVMRAADLALANGYQFFDILDEKIDENLSTRTAPSRSYSQLVGDTVYTTTYGGSTRIVSEPTTILTVAFLDSAVENEWAINAVEACTVLGEIHGALCQTVARVLDLTKH